MSTQNSKIIGKLFFLLAVLILVLAGGLYLSGYIVLMQLKLSHLPLSWDTWLDYYKAIDQPQVRPFVNKIKVSGMIGFGTLFVLWTGLVFLVLKPRGPALHGDARFATGGDLSGKGMFNPETNGIVVGKFGGKILRLSGQQFVILAAPTRSGKGVGIVIPNLLDYQESLVVLDIKQENFDLTSGWRKSVGHEIYLFNPFAEDRRSQRWHPLT